ncbi:MAG TPA: DUF308 domain-containing protein [Acidimicrobiales bacterium]|jgi:uncharacterized membrane protein HdeD (DUF308 family)|nr:DUF308 domain-containing protein [Acidimicrobiales bacterium]
MDPLTRAEAEEVLEDSRGWWMFLLTGILWIIFGFIVLSFDDFETVWAVAVFFGIGFIVGGILELAVASRVPGWKWLHILFGIIAIVAGILALIWPGQTFLVLAAIIGWYVLFSGIMDIITAFVTKDENDLWWLQLVLGIAQVLIGFWAVGYAGRSIALLVIWVGASALARGISDIFIGFGLHSAGKEVRKRMGPTAPVTA